MRIASIDIGSNTLLLLIAEINFEFNKIKTLENAQYIIRISEGLIQSNTISEKSTEKLIETLQKVNLIIKRYDCKIVFASGTHSFRLAKNAKDVIDLVYRSTGIEITILSSDEEAEFSYLGATYELWNDQPISIIDIGGGSTEICTGINSQIIHRESLQIGVVSIRNQFPTEEAFSENEIKEIFQLIQSQVSEFKLLKVKPIYNVALAGTPLTLKAMSLKNAILLKELSESNDYSILSKSEIINIYESIKNKSPKEVLNNYGEIVHKREDLILIGAIILSEILKLKNIEFVHISNKGLRYGAIQKYLFKKFGKYFAK